MEIFHDYNKMSGNTLGHSNINPITNFLQLATDIHARLEAPLPTEMIRLFDQIEEIRPKDRPYHIANANSFYRMSSVLYRNVNLTMGELSQSLSVPFSTTTRMANWWVNNGYATRLSDTSDRRIVRITLTDRGRSLHEIIEDQIVQNIERIISCLTDNEQSTLLLLLTKIASSLEKTRAQAISGSMPSNSVKE